MSNEVVLSIQHLSKWYGATRGIEDISFDVYKGEVFGFLGPNGAGKTTTIRTLLGLVKPSGGSATILGLNAFENQLELRKRIGYLPGLASTYNNYTARGYLRFIAKMRGLNLDSEIESYGSRLKLELDIHIHDLSKGNKQKVSVIQAFMHKPEILFLDAVDSIDWLEPYNPMEWGLGSNPLFDGISWIAMGKLYGGSAVLFAVTIVIFDRKDIHTP